MQSRKRTMVLMLATTLLLVTVLAPTVARAQSPSPLAESPVPGSDGRTTSAWHVATVDDMTDQAFREIVPWEGGFAALGWPDNVAMENQGLDVPVWLSEDGSTWQASEAPIRLPSRKAMAKDMVAFEGGLMAFGSDGRRLLVWSSEDGQHWDRLVGDPALTVRGVPKGYGVQVVDATAADGRVVVSGLYGMAGDNPWYARMWASDDGQTWATSPSRAPSDDPVFSLGPGSDGFIGTVYDRRGCRHHGQLPMRSEDGLRWERLPGAERMCQLGSVAYDERTGSYVATSFKGGRPAVLGSEDGRAWHEVLELTTDLDGAPIELQPSAIHVGEGVIAIVGEGDRIDADDNTISHPFAAVSADGEDWHLSVGWPGDSASHRASAVGHGRLLVAAGRHVWFADLVELLQAPAP